MHLEVRVEYINVEVTRGTERMRLNEVMYGEYEYRIEDEWLRTPKFRGRKKKWNKYRVLRRSSVVSEIRDGDVWEAK